MSKKLRLRLLACPDGGADCFPIWDRENQRWHHCRTHGTDLRTTPESQLPCPPGDGEPA